MANTTRCADLAGYGYMRRRGEPPEPIPPTAIEGRFYYTHGYSDPVQVGGFIVTQSALSEYRQRTGRLPGHLWVDDPSGSYRYLYEITWTADELQASGSGLFGA